MLSIYLYILALPCIKIILTPPNVAEVIGHILRWELFQNSVHAISSVS